MDQDRSRARDLLLRMAPAALLVSHLAAHDMKRIDLINQFWLIAAAVTCAGLVAAAFGAGGEGGATFDDPTQGRVSLMLSHGPEQRSVRVDIGRNGSGTSIQVASSVPTTAPVRRCIARSGVCP